MTDLIDVTRWIADSASRVAGASSADLRVEATPGGRHLVLPIGGRHTVAVFSRRPDALFFVDAAMDLRSALDCLAALADGHRPRPSAPTLCPTCAAPWPCPTSRTMARYLGVRAARLRPPGGLPW